MHLVRYVHNGWTEIGVSLGAEVIPSGHSDLRALITAGPAELDRLRRATEFPATAVLPDRLLAPVADRCQLVFTGADYADDPTEAGHLPAEPMFFPKLWSSVIGPGEPIRLPSPTTRAVWEVKLAVVIGKRAHRLSVDEALDHVFGYTLVNDVSARDVVAREPLQTMLCKSPDTFCPVGPRLVTADEFPDLNRTTPALLTARRNDVFKQCASTDTMIHTIAEVLHFLTRTVTLEPGDLVTTGTPGGTRLGRTPPEFMEPGDRIEVAMEGIGELTNPVVAGWAM